MMNKERATGKPIILGYSVANYYGIATSLSCCRHQRIRSDSILWVLWMTGSKLDEAKSKKVKVLKVKRLMYLETSSNIFHRLRTKQFKMTEMKKHAY